MGDFNLNKIKWNTLPKNTFATSSEEHTFLQFIKNLKLKQFVCEPTRGENYLDLVLSNDSKLASNVQVLPR